ncbi:hypothetical protein QE152_g27453 [Popillia japonica]|uniref:Nuclease HARBI1 n=1 Tax=Popillia japonica TaxID=7064 RepID=A0AAW1JVH6_POPJA
MENCRKDQVSFGKMKYPHMMIKCLKNIFECTELPFNKLVQDLYYLEAQDTNMRCAVPLRKRIAVALYALSSSAEFRTVASLFGIGRTTVGEIVRDFCEAVCFSLQKKYLNTYPLTQEKLKEIVNGFEQMGVYELLNIEIHWYQFYLLVILSSGVNIRNAITAYLVATGNVGVVEVEHDAAADEHDAAADEHDAAADEHDAAADEHDPAADEHEGVDNFEPVDPDSIVS